MRWRPSSRVTATAAIVIAALVVVGCEAKGYGTPPDSDTPQLTVVAPQNNTLPMPEAPPEAPSGGFDGLDARTKQAVADAAKSGADISVVVLDRDTGQTVSGGDSSVVPDRVGGEAVHRRRSAAAGVQGPDDALSCRPQGP